MRKMAFNHLKIKLFSYKKALRDFKKSEKEIKDYGSFKTGYYKGFSDCLRWIIKIFGFKDVRELKMSTEKGDVKAGKYVK